MMFTPAATLIPQKDVEHKGESKAQSETLLGEEHLVQLQQKSLICYNLLSRANLPRVVQIAEAQRILATFSLFEGLPKRYQNVVDLLGSVPFELRAAGDLISQQGFTIQELMDAYKAGFAAYNGSDQTNPYITLMRSRHITRQNLASIIQQFKGNNKWYLGIAVPFIQAGFLKFDEVLNHKERLEIFRASEVKDLIRRGFIKNREEFLSLTLEELQCRVNLAEVTTGNYDPIRHATITRRSIQQQNELATLRKMGIVSDAKGETKEEYTPAEIQKLFQLRKLFGNTSLDTETVISFSDEEISRLDKLTPFILAPQNSKLSVAEALKERSPEDQDKLYLGSKLASLGCDYRWVLARPVTNILNICCLAKLIAKKKISFTAALDLCDQAPEYISHTFGLYNLTPLILHGVLDMNQALKLEPHQVICCYKLSEFIMAGLIPVEEAIETTDREIQVIIGTTPGLICKRSQPGLIAHYIDALQLQIPDFKNVIPESHSLRKDIREWQKALAEIRKDCESPGFFLQEILQKIKMALQHGEGILKLCEIFKDYQKLNIDLAPLNIAFQRLQDLHESYSAQYPSEPAQRPSYS